MRSPGWLVICFLLLSLATSCGSTEAARPRHVARTSGDAVALSYDERVAVVTNRSANSVTVLSLKPERGLDNMVVRSTLLPLEDGSEPWAAIVGADDDTAYVLLRHAQKVVRIDNLRQDPSLAKKGVNVGSEPMALALSPTGKSLFVSNWADGTVTYIDTTSFERRTELDLNQDLLDTQVLGSLATRPGLAHPRALVITDDGDQDDDDETLYATEFFGQQMREKGKGLDEVDSNHIGLVYSRRLVNGESGATIPLSPIKETGFVDSDGQMTSCFANQLFAIAAQGNSLYVTAMCTSPRGPLDRPPEDPNNAANFKTLVHPAVFVIDEPTQEEAPARARLLTEVLGGAEGLYAADDDTDDVRMPLLPNDIAFRANGDGSSTGYVLAQGADALFRLEYARDGSLSTIGSKHHRYVGALPESGYAVGLALSQRTDPPFALAFSDVTQELSIVDVAADTVLQKKLATTAGDANAAAIKSSAANRGKGLFATGLGVWSFQGQAWSSCESCHPGGGSDGVTWYFARGPRRSLSPANTYAPGASADSAPLQRLMLWGSNIDEVHDVEGIVRTVSGGAGAVTWQYSGNHASSNACRIVYDGKKLTSSDSGLCKMAKASSSLRNGLNGSLSAIVTGEGGCATNDVICDDTFSQDWNQIDAFIRELRRPRPPSTLDATRIEAGRTLFERAGCANCHNGPLFTASMLFYRPSDVENGAAPAPVNGTPPTALEDETAALGRLRQRKYNVPVALAALNPAAKAAVDCAPGALCSTFRVGKPESTRTWDFLYGPSIDDAAKVAGDDQLLCALRDVGTFPSQAPPTFTGVAAAGVPPPEEYRHNGKSLAQGSFGFGVPSLFGLQAGGPYFHAGNARTLEEVFDDAFARHYQRGMATPKPLFESQADARNLIEFLLSLSEETTAFEAPSGYDFCR